MDMKLFDSWSERAKPSQLTSQVSKDILQEVLLDTFKFNLAHMTEIAS